MKKQRAPFKVIFYNDNTNIETCVSPYHKEGEPFSEAALRATVDEVADANPDAAQFWQNGVGQVPWWRSRAYPVEEHVRFMRERYNADPSQCGYAKYMADGGDMLAVFLDQCRKRGAPAFFSMRMNDGHGHEFTNRENIDQQPWLWTVFTKWMDQHGHLRIAQNLDDWNRRVFNYIHPEVREYRLAYIREVVEDYDIDGIDLDFCRHFRLFDYVTTSFAERSAVMNELIARVRAMLDKKGGRHRYLSVRVPAYRELLNELGLSIPGIIDAGVDMVNASVSYFTEQETEIAHIIREAAGRARVYCEMCHDIYNGWNTKTVGEYDNFTFMRATDEMFNGTAHLAYEKGADGVAFFNFVYYRKHGSEGRGPFNEPPFHVLRHIGDKKAVAEKTCHYFIAPGFSTHNFIDTWKQLPRHVYKDGGQGFTFEVGKIKLPAARLRVVADKDISALSVTAILNGHAVPETPDVSEFYDKPYVNLVPEPGQCKAFLVDASLMREGANLLALEVKGIAGPFHFVMVETVV